MKRTRLTYRILTFILLWVILCIVVNPISAQEDATAAKSLDKQEIKDLVDLAKYDKTVKRLKPKQRGEADEDAELIENIPDEEEVEPQNSNFSFSGGPIITYLFYLIIVALVVFILVAIFSSIKVDKDIKNEEIIKDEEIEDIEVIDAEKGLEDALSAENYRDAVRMLFIKLLQILVEQDHIKWKPEKTNRDYLREMINHQKIDQFSNLVIAYERIWYGRAPIDEPFFKFLRGDFEQFYSTKNLEVNAEE